MQLTTDEAYSINFLILPHKGRRKDNAHELLLLAMEEAKKQI